MDRPVPVAIFVVNFDKVNPVPYPFYLHWLLPVCTLYSESDTGTQILSSKLGDTPHVAAGTYYTKKRWNVKIETPK
jgi:hypothetical protein